MTPSVGPQHILFICTHIDINDRSQRTSKMKDVYPYFKSSNIDSEFAFKQVVNVIV